MKYYKIAKRDLFIVVLKSIRMYVPVNEQPNYIYSLVDVRERPLRSG